MKLFQALSFTLLASQASARVKVGPIGECQVECDKDEQCAAGLLCSDMHERELRNAGLDVRKAYCGRVGRDNYEVCYDPKQVGIKTGPVFNWKPTYGVQRGLCESDCDLDIDCKPGLWCADEHALELIAAGYSQRAADCNVPTLQWNYEVCFDPKILKKTGGGGGDPHFKTYDGTKYSYHGQSDLVMARSPEFGNDLGLDLHIRTEIVDGWSLISNSAIRIGADTFELSNDGSYYFNGAKNVELPIQMAGLYEVSTTKIDINMEESAMSSHRFEIQLGETESITMTLFKQMISVKVDAVLKGTEGMLGIHGKDGMVGRDRVTILTDANEMGAEWQVRDTEPMLFHDIRAPQFPEQPILPSVSSRRLRMADRRRAEEVCAGVDESMFDFCIDDVMLTGDMDLAHAAYGF